MAEPLEELLAAYLDGDMPAEDAAAFERRLATDGRARRALTSELALRQFLTESPKEPPARLAEAIADALAPDPQRRSAKLSTLSVVLRGLGPGLKGPVLALAGVSTATVASRPAAGSLRRLASLLGPKRLSTPVESAKSRASTSVFGRLIRAVVSRRSR